MVKKPNIILNVIGVILISFSIITLGYFNSKNIFFKEIFFFAIALIGFWILNSRQKIPNQFKFGLFLRLSLIASTPLLSEDYIRFIWDGYLTTEGINPLNFKPSEVYQLIDKNDFASSIYEKLSNKNTYSNSLPLQQWIFYFVALTKSKVGSIVGLRIIIIGFEVATYFILQRILRRYNVSEKRLNLYWINPLVILELTGNLHTEGIFLFFLLTGILSLSKMQDIKGGFFLSLSFCTNIYCLFFLPLLLLKGKMHRLPKFILGFAPFLIIAFMPFVNLNQGEIYSRYIIQCFNIDISKTYIFNLIQWIEVYISQFDLLKIFFLSAGGISLILSWRYRYRNRKIMFIGLTLIISVILLISPSIKPVYILIPLTLSLFTNLTFPLIWSGLIFSHYAYFGFQTSEILKTSFIITEYFVLLILFFLNLKALVKK